MNGIEMMLESFGVNTNEVKQCLANAEALVRVMNEQLGNVKAVVDRIEAKQGQLSLTLAELQAGQVDIEAQLTALNDWMRREEWPPPTTQTLEELRERMAEIEGGSNAGREQGSNSGTAGETGWANAGG